MGNPLVRFCEGQESNCDREEILWHCRESRQKQRKQTSSYSHGRLLSTRKGWIAIRIAERSLTACYILARIELDEE
jgi:hypothetical protein